MTTVPAGVHMCPHPHHRPGPDGCRTAGAGERLFTDMAVQQHPPVDQLPLLSQHLPPIGILVAARIGTADLHRKLVGAFAPADLH